MKYFNLMLIAVMLFSASILYAQDIERTRPVEWNSLAEGGRFMDRFLPIPIQGKLTSECWGVDSVKPRDILNGIEDPDWSYWGGNILIDDQGQYHQFVCRWKENSIQGHMTWPQSEIVHTISNSRLGPFKVVTVVGKGHNPEAFRLKDGRYVVYAINGYYIANSLDGNWNKGSFDFDKRGRKIIEGLSNLSFAQRDDGSYLMVCRGGGIWVSREGLSYQQVSNHSVYPPVEGRYEDPVIWKSNIQYHMIVNDWLGRIAYHLRSKNGIDWKVDPGEAYMPGISIYEDGTIVDWYKYERIKILKDDNNRGIQANFAVIDYLKGQDKGNDSHSSKNISIPLEPGRLISLLTKNKISKDTEKIEILIQSEAGFNALTDVDINSLRYGAPEEVDFGRGCHAIDFSADGKNLRVIFDGKGNGFTEDNFSAKLLGKRKSGKMLFGYNRLSWVNYDQTILSAEKVSVKKSKKLRQIVVNITNFGADNFSEAEATLIFSRQGNELKVQGHIPSIASYETIRVTIDCPVEFKKGKYNLKIYADDQKTAVVESTVRM